MKTLLCLSFALAALAALPACISTQKIEQHQLPAEWTAAIPRPGAPAAELAGVFADTGKKLDDRFARTGNAGREYLSKLLAPAPPSAREARRPSLPGTTTELRPIDATHLEVIVRSGGEIASRHTHEMELDPASGVATVRHNVSAASAALLTAAAGVMKIRLWRAADGRLYAQRTTRAVGEMLLMPYFASTEQWCRWDAAPPIAAPAPSTNP